MKRPLMTAPARLLRIALAGGLAWVPAASGHAQEPMARAAQAPTYATDIAPILARHCVSCHRPSGPAPFALTTHQEAGAWAFAIAEAARTRRMPPWLPAPGPRPFVGERRLSDEEIRTLEAWGRAGAPVVAQGEDRVAIARAEDREWDKRGVPIAGAPGVADTEWTLGRPDLVVEMPKPYDLPATGAEVFRNFPIPVPVADPRWVRAFELRPGGSRAVHHAMIMVDSTGIASRLDAADEAPGYDPMRAGNPHMPQGFLLGWTPGRAASPEPEGFAWRLPPGSDLVLQLHLRPSGVHERVAVRVGLYFASGPPSRRATVLRLGSETIDIPPGASGHVVEDSLVLPVAADVLALYPHAHTRAREMHIEATRPDGSRETLLHIPRWDFDWQDVYRFREPVRLPAGTRLGMRYTYDNRDEPGARADSEAAALVPVGRVVWGVRSSDEMGDLWVQVAPVEPGDLGALETEVARKGLGIHLEGLEWAVATFPDSADIRGQLGHLLARAGRPGEALPHYRAWVELEPEDGNAHYNLGATYARLGAPRDAIPHFARAAALIPVHLEAHAGLVAALVETGRRDEALAHLGTAARELQALGQTELASALRALHERLITDREPRRPL